MVHLLHLRRVVLVVDADHLHDVHAIGFVEPAMLLDHAASIGDVLFLAAVSSVRARLSTPSGMVCQQQFLSTLCYLCKGRLVNSYFLYLGTYFLIRNFF